MLKTLRIENLINIEKFKAKYREKDMYSDLLMFLLIINTGLKISEICNMKVGQIKGKNYIPITNNITFILTKEMKELVNIVTKDKELSDSLFTRRNKEKASGYTYYVNLKNVCTELGIYNDSFESLRRTFGYYKIQKYHNLFFLQWYLNHNTAEQLMNYIDVREPMSVMFK